MTQRRTTTLIVCILAMLVVAILILALWPSEASACPRPTPQPTATPRPTRTPRPTPELTDTPAPTARPTPTYVPPRWLTPLPTPQATVTPVSSVTPPAGHGDGLRRLILVFQAYSPCWIEYSLDGVTWQRGYADWGYTDAWGTWPVLQVMVWDDAVDAVLVRMPAPWHAGWYFVRWTGTGPADYVEVGEIDIVQMGDDAETFADYQQIGR